MVPGHVRPVLGNPVLNPRSGLCGCPPDAFHYFAGYDVQRADLRRIVADTHLRLVVGSGIVRGGSEAHGPVIIFVIQAIIRRDQFQEFLDDAVGRPALSTVSQNWDDPMSQDWLRHRLYVLDIATDSARANSPRLAPKNQEYRLARGLALQLSHLPVNSEGARFCRAAGLTSLAA